MNTLETFSDNNFNASKAFTNFYKVHHKDADVQYAFYARLHQGRALFQLGKDDDARKLYKESVALFKKLTEKGTPPGPHTEFAAEMMYKLTEPESADFMAVELRGKYKDDGGQRGRALERRIKDDNKYIAELLKKKSKGVLELQTKYAEIISTGAGEWGLAAIVAAGQAYENMGDSLANSPCQFHLSDDQCEMYTMGLQDKAYPQTEKAVEAYRLALEKSFDLNLYNENTAYATRRLGELRPEDFPGLEEMVPEPGYTAEKVRAFEYEKSVE